MGFGKWLTGRDRKEESDLYANFDKVSEVIENLNNVKTNEIENAKSAIQEAVTKLNNVNGVAQYVGNVGVDSFDGIFDNMNGAIDQITLQIQNKANDIKEYEESSWLKKAGSTILMGGSKLLEGAGSALEGIGDAFWSGVGWIAPAESGLEKWCEETVAVNWSHDTMDMIYYEKDLAKASRITEDSKAAGCFKIVGEAAVYLYAGGAVGGAASSLGLGSTAVGEAALGVASGSTWASTAVMGVSGLGKGTEVGIQSGKGIDDAFMTDGVSTGVTQAATAFAFGKIGEGLSKSSAVKAQTSEVSKAQEAVNLAKEEVDDAGKSLLRAKGRFANKAGRSSLDELTTPEVEEALQGKIAAEARVSKANEVLKEAESGLAKAQEGLETVKNTKWSNYQGYSDRITKAGEKFGRSAANTSKAGFDAAKTSYQAKRATNLVTKGAEGADDVAAMDLQSKAEAARETFKQEAKSLVTENNPVAQTFTASKQGASKVVTGTKEAFQNAKTAVSEVSSNGIKQTVKDGFVAAKEGISNISIKEGAKTAVSTIGSGAKSVVTNPKTPGVTAALITAATDPTGKVDQRANTTFRPSADAQINMSDNQDWSTKSTKFIAEGTQGNIGGTSGGNHGGGTPSGQQVIGKVEKGKEKIKEELIGKAENILDKTDTGGLVDYIKNETDKLPTDTNVVVNPNNNDTNVTPADNVVPTNDNTVTNTTPTKTITTTPSTSIQTQTPTVSTNVVGTQVPSTSHTGGGYTGSGGYTPTTNIETPTEEAGLDGLIEETTTSIDDIVKGSNKSYSQIPKSSTPISRSTTSSGAGSTVIPIAAGLSAAAAAGIGAKAYIDRKNNNDNGEDDEDDLETEDWSESDTIDLSYDDSSDKEKESFLDDDDDYSYEAVEEEKYDARNTAELADMQ